MNSPYLRTLPAVKRRTFLRGAGAVLALPWLESMARAADAPKAPLRRLIAICTDLGVIPTNFFPTGTGADYQASPYLEVLGDLHQHLVEPTGDADDVDCVAVDGEEIRIGAGVDQR